jgi:hypothetical protein
MAVKDGSVSIDINGLFAKIIPNSFINIQLRPTCSWSPIKKKEIIKH